MFYTLSIIDGEQILWDHPDLDTAEAFARDEAKEGHECMILQPLSVVRAVAQPVDMAEFNGVVPGRDFPGSLARGAAWLG